MLAPESLSEDDQACYGNNFQKQATQVKGWWMAKTSTAAVDVLVL